MLYCVVTEEQYNLAYFFIKRIECARANPTANLPYGMFLTRLYRHIMKVYPHLDNGIYDIVDRFMRPLALKQTRRPRSDHGKARHSVSSLSSHHHGTSSHQHHDDDDDVKTSREIDSIMTILASLDSPVNDEDVVHYALVGLPSKYNQVCGYMHYQDKFPDLKAARSLLITEEMRLKTMDIALPADPSYLKWLCTCRFGEGCWFVHDPNVRNTPNNSVEINASNMGEILVKLLGRLGLNSKHDISTVGPSNNNSTPTQPSPTAYYVSLTQGPTYSHLAQPMTVTPGAMGPVTVLEQATALPSAFTARTLHDPATGAWNMDTGASSHLNSLVTSLSDIFNTCMYPSISVGDRHSIPVTNTGHSILPTPTKTLHLNNVLITPHIVKN
ncbi:hypothetical protein Tco_0324655 [Tanacetum coccineum]